MSIIPIEVAMQHVRPPAHDGHADVKRQDEDRHIDDVHDEPEERVRIVAARRAHRRMIGHVAHFQCDDQAVAFGAVDREHGEGLARAFLR